MGTTARLLVRGGAPEALDRAEDSLHGLEAKWSRFRPETELSLLNAAGGGRPVVVSAVTFALIARVVDAWRRTGGEFDPTGLAAIRAWGYDRDFAEVVSEPDDANDISHPFGGCADIELDPTVRAVTLPRGVTLDLGGIGKGYAADLVSEELVAAGAAAVCVDLGGDLRGPRARAVRRRVGSRVRRLRARTAVGSDPLRRRRSGDEYPIAPALAAR